MTGRSIGRGFEGTLERDSRFGMGQQTGGYQTYASSSPPKGTKKNVMKRILGGQKPQITVPPQNIFAAWPPAALSQAEMRVLASTQSPTIRQSQEVSPLDGPFLYRSSTSPPSTVSPPSTISGSSPEMRARQNFGFWQEPTPLNMQALNYPVSAGFAQSQKSPPTTFGEMGVEARPPTPPRKDTRWMDKVLPTRTKRAVSNPIPPAGLRQSSPPRPPPAPTLNFETKTEKPARVMTAPGYSGAKLARPMSTLLEQDAARDASPTSERPEAVSSPPEKVCIPNDINGNFSNISQRVINKPKHLQPPITGPEWLSREVEMAKRNMPTVPPTPRTPRTPRTPSKGKVRARTKTGRSLSVRNQRNVRGARPGPRVGKGIESRKSSTDSSVSIEHSNDGEDEWVTEEVKEIRVKRNKARSVRRRKGLALTDELIDEYLTRALPPTPLDLARERKPSFQAGVVDRISPREILRARAGANLSVKVPGRNVDFLNTNGAQPSPYRAMPSPYGRTPATAKTIVEDFRMDTITVDDRDDILKWLDSFRFAQKKARQQELALERANTRMGTRRRPSTAGRRPSVASANTGRNQSISSGRMPSISSGRKQSISNGRTASISSLSRKGSIMKSRKGSTSHRRSPPSLDSFAFALPAVAYKKPEAQPKKTFTPPKTPMAIELPGDEMFLPMPKLNTSVSAANPEDETDSPMFCPGQDISLLSPPPSVGLHFLTIPDEIEHHHEEEAPSPMDTRGLIAPPPVSVRQSRLSIASSMGNPFYFDDIMNTIKSNRERNASLESDPFMYDRASYQIPPPPYDDDEYLTTPQDASAGNLFSPVDGHIDLAQVFRNSNIIFDHNPLLSPAESEETEVEMLSDAVYSPPSSRNSPAAASPASSTGYGQSESEYRSMWPPATTKSEPASSPSCITDSSSPRAKDDSSQRYSDNSWEYRSEGGTLMSVDLLQEEIKFMLSDDILLPPMMPAAGENGPESPMKTPARRVFRRNMKFVAGRNSELPGEILFCIKDEDCF